MPANEMGLVGGCSPSPERTNDSFMRGRVPSRHKRYPNFADVLLAEEDPAQSRQLMKKIAERTTRHWIARVGGFVREEGVKAPLFVNDVGLSIKHHRVSIESDPNLSQRTLERYAQLLNVHVKPVLGGRRLQQLQPQEIDRLYSEIAEAATIPDGSDVDLSLVRLPAKALIFPNPPERGADFSFFAPRIPRSVSQAFARRAEKIKRGKTAASDHAEPEDRGNFGNIRFHDLRGIHSTALLDAGIPVHSVAQRIGDDPATLLRNYTKRKRSKTADEKLSDAISALTAGFLQT